MEVIVEPKITLVIACRAAEKKGQDPNDHHRAPDAA
jgi:hypothetical protein